MDINFDKLKNFKLEDLKSYFASYKELFKDKTFVTKVAIGLVIFFINFTIYSVWLSPKLAEQGLKIKRMDDYKTKTAQYNANFSNLQNELNSFKNVTNSVNLFFSKKESEELYQNLSTYATSNGLNITNLVKGNAQKVNVSGAPTVSKDGKPTAQAGSIIIKYQLHFKSKGVTLVT